MPSMLGYMFISISSMLISSQLFCLALPHFIIVMRFVLPLGWLCMVWSSLADTNCAQPFVEGAFVLSVLKPLVSSVTCA